ncbi:oxygenase MpaB family protein [Variovorax sp. LjRoot84]|uniref:oxygenase MpaB family protein n=1 Tax=Variovorax sp. LjRoot84 TaxID=3342340 RepID=UPI003ED0DEFF
MLWLTIALGPGSLTHTYSAPTIAEVLVKTQNLQARTLRRLAETGIWSHQVVRPDGLRPGAAGYVHSLQVRLLHARVRASIAREGAWEVTRGVPISQCDMLRTWLDFTFIPFGALVNLGFTFTDTELTDLYAMWHGVAHLLGIEPELYRGIRSQAQAQAALDVIDADLPPPGADARSLTLNMLEAVGRLMEPALQMPADVSIGLMQAMCRHIHGDALADALQVPRSWAAALLPTLIDANRYRRQCNLASPEQRRQRIAQTLREFDVADDQIHGDTTYQQHAEQLPAGKVPVTPPLTPPTAVAS